MPESREDGQRGDHSRDAAAQPEHAEVGLRLNDLFQEGCSFTAPIPLSTLSTSEGSPAWWLRQATSSTAAAERGQVKMVEPGGLEPPTSCMPCKRSPS